jgi:hypothetical protein
MRQLLSAALVLTLFAARPAAVHAQASPHAAPATAATSSWPATRAGELAHGWVSAFSTGEDSMRRFIDRNLAPKSLEERNTNARVEKYKTLRDQYGKLQLDAVLASTPGELTARLIDSDAKSHEFTFAVQTEAPYKLLSVSIREQMHGIHGMFGGFHH